MTRFILFISVFLLVTGNSKANNTGDSTEIMAAKWQKYADSVRSALKYEQGTVSLPGGVAELKIPAGCKFLNAILR
jgi:hypothetical protein